MILQYIAGKTEVKAKNLIFAFDLTQNYAHWLLHHYYNTDLLLHRRRGVYTLSKRGRDRLEYLKLRQAISNVTGVPIGLNFKKDSKLSTPIHTLVREFQAKGGVVPPGTF